jgi:hypothetical protein
MQIDQRTSGRIGDGLVATCSREGKQWRAKLRSISGGSCCIDLPSYRLARGDRLLLEIYEHFTFPVTISWIGSGKAFLQFTNPLHGMMVQAVAKGSGSSFLAI